MTEPVSTKIASSIIWSLLSRWGSKAIGMVNTVVLARLLTPADFGVIAMAMVVMGLLESMTQMGMHLYLIRQKADDHRVFNSTWTVTLLQSLFIASILVFSAPYAANYFSEPALTQVIYCLALVKVIQGCQNVGLFIAQKQLNFALDFKFTTIVRLSYLFTSIGLALWLRSYWAIVFGQLTSAIIGLLLSYYIHEYRPRFALFEWRKMLKFSASTLPLSLGRFVNAKLDITIIGKLAPSSFLGHYNVGANLASLFTIELLIPAIRGLLPNLSKLKGSNEFISIYTLAVATAVYVFMPLGVGLFLVADEFVIVLLGAQWSQTAPILAWLSLYTLLNGIMMFSSEQILVIIDKEKLSNRLMWSRNIVLAVAIYFTLEYSHYSKIPEILVYSALASIPMVLIVVSRALEIPNFSLVSKWWPAILSCLAMWLVLGRVNWPDWAPVALLVTKVMVGFVVYISTISALYLLRGKPDLTPEKLVLNKLRGIQNTPN